MQRVREEEMKEQKQREEEKNNKKKKVPSGYHPASPVYEAIFKLDPITIVVQKQNWALTQTTTPEVM